MSVLIVVSVFIGVLCALRTLWSDLKYRRVYALDLLGCLLGFCVIMGSIIAWSDAVLVLVISLCIGGIIALLQTARQSWLAPVDGMMLTWFVLCIATLSPHAVVTHVQRHIHAIMQGHLRIPTTFTHNLHSLISLKNLHIFNAIHMLRVAVFCMVLGLSLVIYHAISRQVKAPFLTCAWISFFLCYAGMYLGFIS